MGEREGRSEDGGYPGPGIASSGVLSRPWRCCIRKNLTVLIARMSEVVLHFAITAVRDYGRGHKSERRAHEQTNGSDEALVDSDHEASKSHEARKRSTCNACPPSRFTAQRKTPTPSSNAHLHHLPPIPLIQIGLQHIRGPLTPSGR